MNFGNLIHPSPTDIIPEKYINQEWSIDLIPKIGLKQGKFMNILCGKCEFKEVKSFFYFKEKSFFGNEENHIHTIRRDPSDCAIMGWL